MNPINITDTTFQEEVLQSEKLTLVDFWAEWCGPCKMIAPVLEEIAQEYPDEIKVTKLNVDEYQEVAQAHSVRSIPTLLFFQSGKQVNRVIGFQPKQELKVMINRMLEPVSVKT